MALSLQVNFEDTCKGFLDVAKECTIGRYVDCLLPGGTIDWGCFRHVTTRNRLVEVDFDRHWLLSAVTVDFDCWRPISIVSGRFWAVSAEGGRKKKREKKREKKNLESGVALRPHDPSPMGDFFSSRVDKKCLPAWGEGTRRFTLKTDHLEGLLKLAWRKQLWFMLIICLHRFHGLSNSCIFTMQRNYIREETIERMRLDEEVLMDFFREHLSVTVVQECKEIYEHSLVDGNPPKTGFVFGKVKCLAAPKGIWRKLAQ
ncbi:hypothetical protein BHM03_00000527 [Ensete ventricosum]|nr:hypothetical protein BHM03_00000527 [Ensete ventricosum]